MNRLLCLLSVALIPLVARGDIISGPKAGDKVEDFKAYGVVGLLEEKKGSYVKERKDDPTVFVFVQQEHWTRPMARFLKALDKDGKEVNAKAAVVAIWLSDDPGKAKDYLPRAQMSLNFANTSLGVFDGEKSGPANWGINTDAHCTVVVTSKGKVLQSIALESVNETDAKKVLDVLKKAK